MDVAFGGFASTATDFVSIECNDMGLQEVAQLAKMQQRFWPPLFVFFKAGEATKNCSGYTFCQDVDELERVREDQCLAAAKLGRNSDVCGDSSGFALQPVVSPCIQPQVEASFRQPQVEASGGQAKVQASCRQPQVKESE